MYKVSEILKEVRRLQKQYPDCVYTQESCSYTSGSCKNGPKTKGCLVGQAIRGVYPELFKSIKKNDDTGCSIESIILSGAYDIKGSQRDKDRLQNIQCNQDNRKPWGSC